MEYIKQLARPYARREKDTRSHMTHPFHQPAKKASLIFIWASITIAVTLVCGALYYVYTSLTNATNITITAPNSSTATVAAPTSADLGHSYGIAAGGSLGELNASQLDARMSDIAATGAKWVRFDFNWSIIQPDNATSYDWTMYDGLVAAAQKHKLFILGILDFTPDWARTAACRDSDKCHPADNRQFAHFAQVVANRYKNRGLHYWEIWNEPNNPQFWQPKADPAAYAKLLQAASAALRAEDKDTYLITAGLSPQETNGTSYTPIDFLKGIYTAGAKNSFDAVADHPYTFPLSPKDAAMHAWNQMTDPKQSLRQVMVSNGDEAKKLWITEYGAPTGGPGPLATVQQLNLDQHPYKVDEALQSRLLSDALSLYKSYNWVGPFMYYSYQDAGTAQDTNENFFGLVRADGSKKPAYEIFQEATKDATGQ